MIAFLALHLLAFALLAATAWVAGRLVVRDGFAVETAVGLTLLAHALFALGALGLLNRGAVLALAVAVHLLGFWRSVGAGLAPAREGVNPSPTHLTWKPALLLALAVAPVFVLALYPPAAFDETLYHLPFAREFAESGSIPFLPQLRVPVFPPLAELLGAGVLLLAGDVATHLIQLLATVATAALLFAWGRSAFSPAAGWLAAAAFLGNPIVVQLSATGYVEPLLALFITAAVYSLERWREGGETRWLALAALLAGSAAGVKYLGLFWVGALFLAALRERRWRDLAVFCAVALAVLAPTYGRILLHTGNPLFPFYPEVFGSGLWDPQSAPSRSLGERAADYLRIPWAVLFDRRSLGWQPPYSPAFLLAAPLLAAGLFREPRIRRLLGMALAYSLLFLLLPPDARYLVAVLPLASLALAASLPRWRVPAVALLLLLPGWLYGLYRIHNEGPLPATPAEREAYLRRELPAYAAVEHLDALEGEDYVAYGIYAENMVYHAEGTLLGDWNGPASYHRVLPSMSDPEAFHRRLRGLGAGYLLLLKDRTPPLPENRRFRRIYADEKAEVYELSP